MSKLNNSLKHLERREDTVMVGELEFVIRTVPLMNQKVLMKAISKIDPKPFINAVTPTLDAAEKGGESDDGIMIRLIQNGAAIWEGVVGILEQLIDDDMLEAVAAMVDNNDNFTALVHGEHVDVKDKTQTGKTYLFSTQLREFVKVTVTLSQAIDILTKAFVVNSIGESGKALMAKMFKAAPAATTD